MILPLIVTTSSGSIMTKTFSSTPTAAGGVMSKLENNISDVVVFVSSDSTGNNTNEWVYLLAQWYADNYEEFSVLYYLWNDGTGDYDPSVNVSTGTGSNILCIYNAAISGAKADYIAGVKWLNAVENIPQADLIILNHGHNMVNSYSDENIGNQRVPQVVESIESLRQVHSGAGFIMLTQNPRRDDDTYQVMYETLIGAAAVSGVDIADSYTKFINANKDASLYSDNIHPSEAGSQLFLNSVISLHGSLISKSFQSSFDDKTENLAINGDFSDFDNLSNDWAFTNTTPTKDITNVDGVNGYSVKVAPDVAGSSSRITQTLSSALFGALKGSWVTLSVRVYVGDGSPNTAGRIALTTNSKGANTYTLSSSPRDGFCWRTLSLKILPSDTFAQIKLYGDTGNTDGEASFDRVILTKGRLPKDVI